MHDGAEFSREKSRLHAVFFRISYLLRDTAEFFIGKKLVLKVLLNTSWILNRLAFESCGRHYGHFFHNNALVLNEEVLSALLPKNSLVIDLGAGDGRWTKIVHDMGHRVIAVDKGNELSSNLELDSERIVLLQKDILNLDLMEIEEPCFVLLIHVLEHIERPRALLENLRRINATLLIEVPDWESDPRNWARLNLRAPIYTDADHVREYSQKALIKDLEESGWHSEKFFYKGGAILAIATKTVIR